MSKLIVDRTVLAGLVLALLLAAALGWLAADVARGQTMSFDSTVRNTIHDHASQPLTIAMKTMSFIGEPFMIWPLTMLAVAYFWRTGNKRHARLFVIAMLGAAALDLMLKAAFHRPRPRPFFGYPLPSSYSFPSGHALASLVFFGTLAALLSPGLRRTFYKALLWLAAVLLIAAIGFSRIYLGVHYPTDVIAGYAAATIWVLAIAAGNRARARRVQRT